MSILFSRSGFHSLRLAYGLALISIVMAGGMIILSYFYWQQQEKENVISRQQLSDLDRRLETARRERDDLKDSAQLFSGLQKQGLFLPQNRLDMIEQLSALQSTYQLVDFTYELQPQRALTMADGKTYPQVDIQASRLKMNIQAYHDGDLLAFFDAFPRQSRGLFPMESCRIQRKPAPGIATDVAKSIASSASIEQAMPATATPMTIALVPGLQAECILDWISLRDKLAPATAVGARS